MGCSNSRDVPSSRDNLLFSIPWTLGLHADSKERGRKTRKNIIKFIENDLEQRLNFIEESLKYKDYKPFFTDMWDAVILAGKHALLSFELFQSLQRSYSWMKYYNSELESIKRNQFEEKELIGLLSDVRQSIEKSIQKLMETGQI